MALTRRDRFHLKSQIVEELQGRDWSWDRTNILLAEFGLPTLTGDYEGPALPDVISSVSDEELAELYGVVMNVEPDEVATITGSDTDGGNWKVGYARVFLSHSAHHKQFVGEVADELAVVGVHGFVAHDTIAYSKPWQSQIEQALRSMQAFVALVHPEFNESPWCHQEAGWALGRRVPHFVVRMGANPLGFLASDQWPSGEGRSAKEIAALVSEWLSDLPELGSSIVDGLLSALETAGNYYDAEAKAERVAALGSLTDEQFDRLDRIWWSNDQLHGGALPTRVMRPFYASCGRSWPPPRPSVATDEEPF